MNKLIQKHIIPCYQTDSNWRLKPAAFMDLAQEAANSHAAILGFGYDDLVQSRTAWILSRVNIRFIKTPLWRDEVTLTTWHKGLERLFFLRDFIMTDKDGNECVKATSSWLVLNLDTRRLVRDPKLMDEGTTCSDNAMESPAAKVQMPKDLEPELVMDHVVSYSDVDLLGHTNNAMYMNWHQQDRSRNLQSTSIMRPRLARTCRSTEFKWKRKMVFMCLWKVRLKVSLHSVWKSYSDDRTYISI